MSLEVDVSENEVQVPTWLTSDMVGSTSAMLLVVLRPGLSWAPGDLILPSVYIGAFLLFIVPRPTRVPQEKSSQNPTKSIT